MNSLAAIPWLVQEAKPGQTHCPNQWDTVIASTSREAAITWLENHPFTLPITVRVAGAAPSLRYANGMPMLSREFIITHANES